MYNELKNGNLISIIDNIPHDRLESDGLMTGRLGVGYYYYILFKEKKNKRYLNIVENILTEVLERVDSEESDLLLNPFIKEGISGLGFFLKFLVNENILEEDILEKLLPINEMVYRVTVNLLKKENYDFLDGSIGLLYYLNYVGCEHYTNLIIDIIYQKYVKEGYRMFYNNSDYITGIHFGYAHGLFAIIKVLNNINDKTGKCDFMIKDMLKEINSIVYFSKKDINGYKYYVPRNIYKIKNNHEEINYRPVLAWSNSDLNFSTLIYSLNRKYVTNELENTANIIALESTKRKKEAQTNVFDYRFFFGSSGVLQMYNFLYQKTKNEELLYASQFWYEETLRLLKKSENEILENKLDFLNNLLGTNLALLEYQKGKSLHWSKLYLL
jgi:hypothetical protein